MPTMWVQITRQRQLLNKTFQAALMNPKEAKRLLCQPLLQLPDPSSTCSNTSAEPNDSDSSLQRASPVRIIDHASSYKSPHKTHADPQACDDGWHRLFQKAVVQSRHPPPEHRVDIFSPSSTKPVEIQGRYKSDVQPGKPRMHRTRHFGNAEQARPERRSNDPVLHEFEDDSVYREIAALIKRGQEALESQECQVEYSRARSGRRPLTSRSNSPHKGSPAASSQCSSSYNSPRRCRRESHEIRKLNVTPVKMYTEDTEIDGQSPFLREEMARARERYLARRK